MEDFTQSKFNNKTTFMEDYIKYSFSATTPQQAPESIATLPPFGPIEGQKRFDQISSPPESQKNRFALISFGKIQFLPPCI
jgi:hypothetical protein